MKAVSSSSESVLFSIPFREFLYSIVHDLRSRDPGYHLERFDHLMAAVDWLRRAQDMSADDGVSHSYSIKGGWRPSYVETTGYIIETFYHLTTHLDDPEYANRATRMARWLLTRQLDDGSFTNPELNPDSGLVFDTGQDLFGLVNAYRQTGDDAFLVASNKAGAWLVEVADDVRQWTRSTFQGIPHVYNARTAWALLELNSIHPEAEYEAVARANLDWALDEQNSLGWFDNCAFSKGAAPFTHTIAYAARGLLESAARLDDEKYLAGASRVAEAASALLHDDGFLPGQVALDGTPDSGYCCLTGNCQFAIVWGKLFKLTGKEAWRDAAVRAVEYVCRRQQMRSNNPDIRGGIAGSYPIWGRYQRLQYPNWAAKFFVDAVLLVEEIS